MEGENEHRSYFIVNLHEDYVAELGFEFATTASAVSRATDCAMEPGSDKVYYKKKHFAPRGSKFFPVRVDLFITKTCLYNFDPHKPHFYIGKLGFTGVYIIFLISAQTQIVGTR